jgi:hypothetical protein
MLMEIDSGGNENSRIGILITISLLSTRLGFMQFSKKSRCSIYTQVLFVFVTQLNLAKPVTKTLSISLSPSPIICVYSS